MTRQSPISSRASIAASAKPTIPSALKANAEVESFAINAEDVRRSTPKTFVDQRRRRSRSTPKAFPINAEGVPISAEGVPDQRRRRSRSAPKAFVDQRRRRSSIQRPKAFPINAEGVPNQRRRRSRISAQGCFNPRKRKQSTSTTLKALANQRC
jgi:hypothetical protein